MKHEVITVDMNDLYNAITSLETANDIMKDRLVHGTNSSIYDVTKINETVIRKARTAYKNLSECLQGFKT